MHSLIYAFKWFQICLIVVINRWYTKNIGLYVLSLIFTFTLCIVIEGLNFLRYHLQASAYSKLTQ